MARYEGVHQRQCRGLFRKLPQESIGDGAAQAVTDQNGALDLRVAHYGFDGTREELDGIRAMRFVARAVAWQVDQQRTALRMVIKRLLAAPEREIASPAMDEYQRLPARAVALIMDPHTVESGEARGVIGRRPGLIPGCGYPHNSGRARGSQCQESPPGHAFPHCRN